MKTRLIAFLTTLLMAGPMLTAANHANSDASCADHIIGHYFATQEALAADDFEAAISSTKALNAAQKDSTCSKDISKATQAILKSSDIKEARIAFKKLSDAMIPLVESDGIKSTQAHLVYCPMAFDFTGASWLQKDKSVTNPYFGAQMFACGAVKSSFGNSK
ncbi:DUF3347 domain-containing protein [Opitutia bacterium ISCC 51]|nr:DUF3347 domain-containing protein [Opitutae bacterium ISCC 51]QXD27964.1 DUF3347 domain-containing protein [Opitutae bacterium ISCC 52]